MSYTFYWDNNIMTWLVDRYPIPKLHELVDSQIQNGHLKLGGLVETDETFIGGLERNKHFGKRSNLGHGPVGKTIVWGAIERSGRVVASVVPDTKQMVLDRIFGEKRECHVLTSVDDGYSYYSRSVPSEEADRWAMIGKVFPLEDCPTAADSGAYGYGEYFECPSTAKGYCGCQYKAEIERIAKEILKP